MKPTLFSSARIILLSSSVMVRATSTAFIPSGPQRIHHRRYPTITIAYDESHRTPTATAAITSPNHPSPTLTRRFMSSNGSDGPPSIQSIGMMELQKILNDITNGNGGSGYVVIDVRGEDEVAYTGKISSHANTLPLPLIAQMGAFAMEDEDFEESFGFVKPGMDETIVFTCKAGIRSMQAARLATMAGYSNLLNYSGGADEWFQ